MKQVIKKRMAQVIAVLLAIATVICFIPQTATQAYAESGDPVVGLTGVLETGANTDNAQTVYYGVNGGTPIAWRVIKYKTTGNAYIENQDGAMTLFAADNLTSGVQFATNGQNYYATSNLKVVLDGNDDVVGMYKSLFSTQEQSAIESRTLGVAGYTDVEPYSTGISGNQTSGYLWPLSTAEAFTLPSVIRSASSPWWLRSPGNDTNYAAIVFSDGIVFDIGYYVDSIDSVRPAFNLNLSSVLFTSAAEGGKSSGAVGAGALKPISANPSGEWKLTVHDSSRDIFKASAATGAVLSAEEGYTSWSIPIDYKVEADDPYTPVAVPGDKDYVSVILADNNDNALYYDHIDKANNGGTKNVTIPTGLVAGEYKLHVFYEEINDDYLTDYSSAFRTIDLTVTVPIHTVTVNNGDGDGQYAKDAEVTITADAPEAGMQFKEWIGDVDKVTFTEGSKTTSSAKFRMPAEALTFEATYEAIPAPPEPIKIAIPTGKTLTYNGQSQTGVAAGTGYTLSGTTSAVNAGSYQATATLDEGYAWSDGSSDPKTIGWKINKATVNVTAPSGKTFTYNGKAQTGVAAGTNYTLCGTTKATNSGSYTAKATLKTNANYTYKWSDGTTAAKTISWKINKAANPLTIKAKTATVKYSKLKKKAQTLAVTKVITFTKKGQGKMTYTKASGNKKIIIAKTTGKVTVKKGLKKGTYKVKVKVKAGGNTNYNASAVKTVTFKIKVK